MNRKGFGNRPLEERSSSSFALRRNSIAGLRTSISHVVRLFVPPVILLPLDRWRVREIEPVSDDEAEGAVPFHGNGHLWIALIAHTATYAEWGMGESTDYALRLESCTVRSVETSDEWFTRTCAVHGGNDRFEGILVDLGEVGSWGRPKSYAMRHRITDYLQAPFLGERSPELVLVDGRFRVACVLSALLQGDPGMIIVIDDYVGRPHYHVLEEVLTPIAVAGRQAVYVRPDTIDATAVRALLAEFTHVMD